MVDYQVYVDVILGALTIGIVMSGLVAYASIKNKAKKQATKIAKNISEKIAKEVAEKVANDFIQNNISDILASYKDFKLDEVPNVENIYEEFEEIKEGNVKAKNYEDSYFSDEQKTGEENVS